MRSKLVVFAIAGAVAVIAPPASSAPKGTVSTAIAGAWQSTPALFPTGGDPQSCRFTFQSVATLHGAFTGVWHEIAMTTVCDQSKFPSSVPYRAAGTGTFDGVYFGDGSRGSFTWKGVWRGDEISQQLIGDFDVTSSSGDPTWRCTTLHLSYSGIVNAATGFGGYRGTWIHKCRS